MYMKICSVDDCGNDGVVAHGLCRKHYTRLNRHGDPLKKLASRDGGACSLDGCDAKVKARGFCSKHYQRWASHGDPSVVKRGGERDVKWRGGRQTTSYGYVYVYLPPDHAFAEMRTSKGYVLEHRLVMAQNLGRPLTSKETVHHINGVRDDNRLENLQLRSGHHGPGSRYACLECGSHNVVAEEI